MNFTYRRSYRGPIEAVLFDWAGTTMDFGCIAPAEVFVEVFGFWRKGDIETHYKNLAKGAPGKFVLCVSEQMRADEADEVIFGNGVYRYKRTPLPEEVARVAGLVAGV